MAPLIPIALQLAQYAPSLMRFFGAADDNVNTAQKVVEIAQTVTGTKSPTEALEMFQADSAKRYEFNLAVMENETAIRESHRKDMESARQRDMLFIQKGTRNYRADLMFLLAVFVIIGIAGAIWNSPNLNEYTKGIATLILGRFLGYLDNIYNFEFGSTRSSKTKDSTIEHLSKENKSGNS